MNISDIISLARSLSYTNASEVTDEKVLLGINSVYSELYTIFCARNKDVFEETYLAKLENGRTRYPLPEQNAEQNGLKSINRVYLLWANGEYIAAREISIDTWEARQNGKNLDIQDPCYVNKGDAILVGPTPVFDQADGLKIIGPCRARPLTVGSGESDIFLPADAYSLLAYGAVPYLFALRGMQEEKDRANRAYLEKKEAFFATYTQSQGNIVSASLPPLSSLQ